MHRRLRVKELTQTCSACPSQWEGTLDDGRMVYVRYRWGYLSVRVSPGEADDVMDAVGGEEVFGAEIGDELAGVLTYQQLRDCTSEFVEWPL